MRRYKDQILYSASDLMHFLSCKHAAALDILNLDSPLQKAEDTDQQEMFQRRGLEHEKAYLEELLKSGRSVIEITVKGVDLQAAMAATLEAMKSGVDVIYNCNAEWLKTDHLCQVANIKRDQIHKLNEAGFSTLEQLAKAPADLKVRKMGPETATRLRAQADLQLKKREDGENHLEKLPLRPGRGFERLPQPNIGDLFFDMEGDPLYDGGLEYLFGVIDRLGSKDTFTTFWAHDHAEEKLAFEKLMDFFTVHLVNYPDAHIYHYNHYEPTALKRLTICQLDLDLLLWRLGLG